MSLMTTADMHRNRIQNILSLQFSLLKRVCISYIIVLASGAEEFHTSTYPVAHHGRLDILNHEPNHELKSLFSHCMVFIVQ